MVVALGAAALLVAVLLSRTTTNRPDPKSICRSLQDASVVSDCRARQDSVEYGVRVVSRARFVVQYKGRKAYSGIVAEFKDVEDLVRFLAAANEEQQRAARRTAAATEIASDSTVAAPQVLAELRSVQIRSDRRKLAVHLVPVYGGPQQAVQGQVEAIRTSIAE